MNENNENLEKVDAVTADDTKAEMMQMLKDEVKAELMAEMKNQEAKDREALVAAKEAEKAAYVEYVESMKKSTEPWVDIQGWVDTEHGVRVELEWNDAFVANLREQGVPGTDEDSVVQKWITILLMDMANRMEESDDSESNDFG